MPSANIRGANINYEVIGTRGEWIAFMPRCELHILTPGEHDVDMSPNGEWVAKQDELAALFADFLRRVQGR
jgi:hypothetical protein